MLSVTTIFSKVLMMSCAALGLGFTACQQVQAHGIQSSLRYLDGNLELTSSFSTGEPVKGAAVRLINPDGTAGVELGKIGTDGQLTLALPELAEGVLDLQVDGGPGHRDYLELPILRGNVVLEEVVEIRNLITSKFALAWLGAPALLGLVSLINKNRRSA